jgi:hypothetical protein
MALTQCAFILIIQAIICSQNSLQVDLLPPTDSNVLMSNTNDDTTIPMRAADRLSRIQWENIAFIGFHIWFLGMAVDAVSLFFGPK